MLLIIILNPLPTTETEVNQCSCIRPGQWKNNVHICIFKEVEKVFVDVEVSVVHVKAVLFLFFFLAQMEHNKNCLYFARAGSAFRQKS